MLIVIRHDEILFFSEFYNKYESLSTRREGENIGLRSRAIVDEILHTCGRTDTARASRHERAVDDSIYLFFFSKLIRRASVTLLRGAISRSFTEKRLNSRTILDLSLDIHWLYLLGL